MSYIALLDSEGNPVKIDPADVVLIRPTPDGPVFQTKDAMYYYPTTLEELLIVLKDVGFERLDRTNIVNLNQAKAFDPKARKVYFEHPWGGDSKFATVSEANVSKVQHLAKEESADYKTKAILRPSLFWKK
ncbi:MULTISPECIES: LytTR family transcriptional regulator DNA-binding domain-containing protein [Cohnella]|uniref:LytTr DNA-binding domain-containing protein n=1 Tax=Cohnella phaseoli TaxID=456490 RepID=A0A3D9IY08_9BACL|nr:LytTR family transcriptional regulator DNA-binding domain-containing protein [Cohnella phaseoli]RED66524.1 LytTr DNA-binding domain-containing protein [Cohnella phaseoli]